jgi:hypothetical protein
MILFLAAAALLLAKSDHESGPLVEVRTSNAAVEIIGSDADQVTPDDPSRAVVRYVNGRAVVDAEVPNIGPMRVRVPKRSSLEIVTSNAAIRISGVSGPMRLSTSNGAIEIALPPGLNANISAHTSNAHIHSDVEIAATHAGADFLEGKIGLGGPELQLQTSNAPIYLKNDGARETVVSTFKADPVK